MPATIRSAAERARLTAAEKQVLTLVAAGLLNKEVASRLGVRPGTVSQHLESAAIRLDTRTRPGHVRAALRTGQISAPVLPGDAPDFTGTELTLLRAYTRHSTLGAIATAAGISQPGVKVRVAQLVKKAGARDRAHLIGLAHAWGLAVGHPTTGGRRALLTALLTESVSGEHGLGATSPGTDILTGNRPRTWAGWSPDAPDRSDPAAQLAHVLTLHGVDARVETVSPALSDGPGLLRIALEPAGAIPDLIADITAELTAEAVRLLSAAFTALGINGGRVRAHERGGCTIHDLDHLDALRLYDVLATGPHNSRFDENAMDRHDLEDLAGRLGPLLSAASGGHLSTEADPASPSCAVGRPHRITVGSLTPAQAQRLAAAIHQALTPP
ncbi:helix-turn-helix transcriptional regulator [Streptomyces sp. IB2014 016-6]|uniref:helix-turn-helix transcriptional regulator n=1 Tax=Streptomyces sp. IB2014 016-6 TaxID=2517818 RepID=UPI0011CCD287|nr:helix-turn-helix transcriptional regulator [Streptomyces sp. IB2014 016-6]TXL83953.1 LuxR family transcriptional regulator [Streptomyces sp. IB2014 016-6]